jgi:GT2 family glycosyltransferase
LQATAEALAAEGTEKEEPVRELSAQVPGKEQVGRALTAQETEKEQAAQALAAEWTEKEEAVRELSAQAPGKEQAVQALTAQETEKEQAAQAREAQATVNDQAVQAPNGQLQEMANTRGSWLRQKIMAVRFKPIPAHTGREGLMRFLRGAHWLSPKILVRELVKETRQWLGGHPWAHNFIKSIVPNRIRKWLKHKVETRNPLAANTNLAHEITQEIAKSELSDWEEYLIMYGKIQAIRDSRLAGFQTRPVKITSVHQKDISPVARSLNFPQSNHPEISIVIPVHNNLELTLECLLSIKQHTHACRYEIVVVDDGSDQGTKDVLAAISHITLVRNDERIGFTFSCNKGAKKAKGRYLLFMNNDVQVTENWLQPLADVFRDQKSVGAVGPKVLNLDGRLQEAGAFINPDGTATLIGYHDNPDLPRYNHIREVDYCSGVCLLVKTDTFNEVGGFDPVYAPAYYEDVDLCLKLRSLGLRILYNPHSVIVHHLSATMKKIDSEFKTQLVTRNRQIFLERWQSQIDELNKTKLIAFYLPQFHPIPENDLWWGKGFTEWTNVVRAQPNFVGHYQPHLPSDLGFYDLRNADIMDQQIELAKRYGIFGFCYYYYWFDGKRLLEMPIERMIKTGKPDFPFCICWANENWTRRWDGDESHVLIGQKHSEEDDRAVIRDMIRYLQHPNYIRVEGKPLLVVYRVSLFPDFKKTAETWRKICREEGVGEIQIVMAESFEFSLRAINPQDYGADALVEFPPHNMFSPKPAPGEMINRRFSGQIMDYNVELLKYVQKDISPCVEYKTVMPGWDNTARKQDTSYIFEGSSPGAYQAWLEEVIRITREQNSNQQRIVFINAWNEWGEGNHLEPDQRYGHRYLEATLNALNGNLLENRQR